MPCDLCPEGEYQPDTMRASCVPCPNGLTTFSQGAADVRQCGLPDIVIREEPEPVISGLNLSETFTITSFVKIPSDLAHLKTSFALYSYPGPASLGCGTFSVYLVNDARTDRRTRRQWHHVALTNEISGSRHVSLYVDGVPVESRDIPVTTEDDDCNAFKFTASSNLQYVIVSDIQAVKELLTPTQIATLAGSCSQKQKSNFLTFNNLANATSGPSTCDATDNCVVNPCGAHGVCLDDVDTYQCVCDGFWSGRNCEWLSV